MLKKSHIKNEMGSTEKETKSSWLFYWWQLNALIQLEK